MKRIKSIIISATLTVFAVAGFCSQNTNAWIGNCQTGISYRPYAVCFSGNQRVRAYMWCQNNFTGASRKVVGGVSNRGAYSYINSGCAWYENHYRGAVYAEGV